MGFSRQQYWNGLLCSQLGTLPDPGMELKSLLSPALAGGFFTSSATWEARFSSRHFIKSPVWEEMLAGHKPFPNTQAAAQNCWVFLS